MNDLSERPLAVVTGASSGIGLELATLLAKEGYDLIIAADRALDEAGSAVRDAGADVVLSLQLDLSEAKGVDKLNAAIEALNRPIEILCANAGHGLGEAFFDEDLDEAMAVLETNVLGTTRLIWHVGRAMRERGNGKILITSSTASLTPGPWAAVYFASKAALESFGHSLRVENKNTGVSVTLLLPGATATEFFQRARSTNTKGAAGPMDDAAEVARAGYDALITGRSDVIFGEHNRKAAAESRSKSEAENAELVGQILKPGSA